MLRPDLNSPPASAPIVRPVPFTRVIPCTTAYPARVGQSQSEKSPTNNRHRRFLDQRRRRGSVAKRKSSGALILFFATFRTQFLAVPVQCRFEADRAQAVGETGFR